jgi:hypothetical protein
MASSSQHGNEPSGSIRSGEFLTRCVTIRCLISTLLNGVSFLVSQTGSKLSIYLLQRNEFTVPQIASQFLPILNIG